INKKMNYNKLNTLLKERKLSKLWLANESGLSDVTIDKILNGEDVKVSSVEAVSAVLGLSASYFFDEPNHTANTATGQQSIAGNNNTIAGNITLVFSFEGSVKIIISNGGVSTVEVASLEKISQAETDKDNLIIELQKSL
ncbi:MAG: hypothetical protein LUG51_05865, partial [Tannerellaceae bacterium]|nr:hypothetical protein [Tannerellaceae bacterium]